MTGGVRIEKNGPVTTVIMNRPEARNAVNGPAAAGLYAAFDEFDRDDSAAVAVLWGDNGTFCAGADLQAGGDTFTPEEGFDGIPPDSGGTTALRIYASRKPVIVAVNAEDQEAWIDIPISGTFADHLNPEAHFAAQDGHLKLPLNANWGRILVAR